METVVASEIQSVKGLQLDPAGTPKGWKFSRPVFLVTMKNQARLVVKAELNPCTSPLPVGVIQTNVTWGSKMMKRVSPGVHVHKLLPAECQALNGLDAGLFPPGGMDKVFLESALAEKWHVWFKMDLVDQLTNLLDMVEKGDGQLALQTLKTEAALKNLGKIVAVDLFLGNTDRFRRDGSLGGSNNLFLEKIAGSLNPVGLDFYNTTAPGSNLVKEPPLNWEGLILKNNASMYAFAASAIDGLNKWFTAEFKRTKTPFRKIDLIDPYKACHFHYGMIDGANALKAYLKSKNPIPSGIASRMKLLDWARAA